jgi:hypothetical protein
MNYQKYITSSKWKRSSARKAELKSAGYRCRGCYAPADRGCALELHHRTYERLLATTRAALDEAAQLLLSKRRLTGAEVARMLEAFVPVPPPGQQQ